MFLFVFKHCVRTNLYVLLRKAKNMVMMMMMEIKREEEKKTHTRVDGKQRVTNKDSKILNGLVLMLLTAVGCCFVQLFALYFTVAYIHYIHTYMELLPMILFYFISLYMRVRMYVNI